MRHNTVAVRLKQILPENFFAYCRTYFFSSFSVINFHNTKNFYVTRKCRLYYNLQHVFETKCSVP